LRQWNICKNDHKEETDDENKIRVRIKDDNVDTSNLKRLFPKKLHIKNLIDNSKRVTFNKGESVFDQGNIAQPGILFIVEGSVEVTKDFGDGNYVFLEILRSPESFCHATFLLRGHQLAFKFTANEDGTIISLVDGHYLDMIFYQDKKTAAKYFHLMSQQLSTNITAREKSLLEAKQTFNSSSRKKKINNKYK